MTRTLQVWVASNNPAKRTAVRRAFARTLGPVEVYGMAVPSGVSDQPVGEETWRGARQRVDRLREHLDAGTWDYLVGIEGGIEVWHGTWMAFGVVWILHQSGRTSVGVSPAFPLPPAWVDRLHRGEELGVLVDEASGRTLTKHQEGAIGFLTRGAMDRAGLYEAGVLAALTAFLRPELYPVR